MSLLPSKLPGQHIVVNIKNEKLTKAEANPQCAFCSMRGEFACDHKGCLAPLCRKHVHHVKEKDYCKTHRPLTFTVRN